MPSPTKASISNSSFKQDASSTDEEGSQSSQMLSPAGPSTNHLKRKQRASSAEEEGSQPSKQTRLATTEPELSSAEKSRILNTRTWNEARSSTDKLTPFNPQTHSAFDPAIRLITLSSRLSFACLLFQVTLHLLWRKTDILSEIIANGRRPLPNSRQQGREWHLAREAEAAIAQIPPHAPTPAPTFMGNGQTQKAKARAHEINTNGRPATSKCAQCVKNDSECITWDQTGLSCGHCVGLKQKCGFVMADEGRQIRTEGVPAPNPCAQCVQKGTPAECYQPNPRQAVKLGTACSECQMEGARQTCSINERPRLKNNKVRTE